MTNFETGPILQPNIVVADKGFKFNLKTGLILGVVLLVLIESVWLYFNLKAKNSNQNSLLPPISSTRQPVKMALSTSKTDLQLGEEVLVSVNLTVGKAKVDGVDAYLSYDPQILEATAGAVIKTGLFPEYPQAGVSPSEGKIRISAISDTKGGAGGDGILAKVLFKAKKTGKTEVKFDFTPGSTTDSNVVNTENPDDLLEKVEGLSLMVK